MILKHNPRSYIFRLRIPFDEYSSPRNYITKLLNYENLVDVENSLSHRGDFARYCIDLLEKKSPHGTYNITNKGSITTREVVDLIKHHLKPSKHFNFFKDYNKFLNEVATPRSNCVLDTSKLENIMHVRTAKQALNDALAKYDKR